MRPLMALNLNQFDTSASAFKLEPRYPFLDRRVIECVLEIPPEVKRGNGRRKMLIQRALSRITVEPPREPSSEDYLIPIADDAASLAMEARWLEEQLGPPESGLFRYADAGQARRLLGELARGNLQHRTPL